MRVRPRFREERGAVAVIVGLILVVLLGMLALVVDLGRAVAIKRDMVNGADAAALGAAQECAIARDLGSAQSVAANLTSENRDGATVTSFSAPDCEASSITNLSTVTVKTLTSVDYLVAPVIGFEGTDVVAEATAVFGPLAGAHGVPITVNYETLLGCGIPTTPPAPGSVVECDFIYPKDGLLEPRWGILDLSHWDEPDAAPCHVDSNTLTDIIRSGGSSEVYVVNPPPEPTWDCIDNSLSFSVWKALEGGTLLFPVIDVDSSTGEFKPAGGDCTGAQANCQIDTANVLGWIQLYVPPGGVTKHGDDVFVHAEWSGGDLGDGTPGAAPDFGVYGVRLVD